DHLLERDSVLFLTSSRCYDALTGALGRVGHALPFGLAERRFSHENSLALIAAARPAEFDDNCVPLPVFGGATGECGVAARQELQLGHARAGETQGLAGFYV